MKFHLAWWSVRLDVDYSCDTSAFPPTPEKLVDITDGEDEPCEVVSHADALDPSLFGGETCGIVEISDCLFDGGELVDTIDDFHVAWDVFGKIFDVIEHFGGGGKEVYLIEGFGAGRPIE